MEDGSKRIYIVILLLLTANAVYAQSEIPNSIVEKSNKYIISKVGKDFFDTYMKINFNQSYFDGYYRVYYDFGLPKEPHTVIRIAIDVNGNVIVGDTYGIPINETDAIRIAGNAGLGKGIAPWKTKFQWSARNSTYVWSVQNTTFDDYTYATGIDVAIDANSGAIIGFGMWVMEKGPFPTPTPKASPTPTLSPTPTPSPSPTSMPGFEAVSILAGIIDSIYLDRDSEKILKDCSKYIYMPCITL